MVAEEVGGVLGLLLEESLDIHGSRGKDLNCPSSAVLVFLLRNVGKPPTPPPPLALTASDNRSWVEIKQKWEGMHHGQKCFMCGQASMVQSVSVCVCVCAHYFVLLLL